MTHLSQKNLTQIGQNDVGKSISLTNTERKEKHARLYHVFQMNGFFLISLLSNYAQTPHDICQLSQDQIKL